MTRVAGKRGQILNNAIHADEVHVWVMSLDKERRLLERCYQTLTADERKRCARFRQQADQHRFSAGHGMLRILLSRYLDLAPSELQFICSAEGKPSVVSVGATQLEFNVAHSGNVAMCAISSLRVGVDVEVMVPNFDLLPVVEQAASATEVAEMRSVEPQLLVTAFYRWWTRKEACLKGLGLGFSSSLDTVRVPVRCDDNEAIIHVTPEVTADVWKVHSFVPRAGYAAAVAAPGTGWHPVMRDFV